MASARLHPGWAYWKGSASTNCLGRTREGIAGAVSQSWIDDKQDQFGNTIMDKWGAGIPKATCDLTLAEMTAARMATVCGTTATSGLVRLTAASNIGTSMLLLAGKLEVFPIKDGVRQLTAQFTMPLAYPAFDIQLAYSSNPQGIKSVFHGFPDENDGFVIVEFREV
jgi:hypothetical protein